MLSFVIIDSVLFNLVCVLILHYFSGGESGVPRPPSLESAHSNASVVHRMVADMPHAVDRIWQLR